MEQEIIAWDAPEYHHVEKNSDWYWILGIIAVSIAVLSVLFGNTLLAILILIAAVCAGMYAAREPKIAHFELQPQGIVADDMFYPFKTLESFWVDEHHPLPRIILKSKKTFVPHIIVPFSDIHPDDIRDYLVIYLHEVEHEPTLAHRWLEHLGL